MFYCLICFITLEGFFFFANNTEGILLFELHKDWLDTFGFTDNNAYQAELHFQLNFVPF